MTSENLGLIPGRVQRVATALFDNLEERWSGARMRRVLARALVVAFLLSIVVIELARQEVFTTAFGKPLPTNHFYAISGIVTLLLVIEVLDLIFGLAESVSRMIGKQLEIFSLVLLRKTFDALPEFPEPVEVKGNFETLLEMGSDALGAILVFLVLAAFYRIQRHEPVSDDADDVARFIGTKKVLCLVLLGAFTIVGSTALVRTLSGPDVESTLSLHFFELFYTILIFADVLIVLASLGATRGYRVVFRNFAFGFVTVFLRLALAAGPFWNAAMGVTAALFALSVSAIYRLGLPERPKT